MTAAAFRRLALSLEGTIESAHMGHPDFRAGGRIFATLQRGGKTGMVKLTPEQQARFLQDYPQMFTPEAGAWGRQGCTRVDLPAAEKEAVGEAMTLAWQAATAPRPPKKSGLKAPKYGRRKA